MEKLANISIMLTALLALMVSIWQVQLFQNHNKLSVKPYLDYSIIQQDSTLWVSFTNKGLGPAIIQKITYTYEGKEYLKLYDLLKEIEEHTNLKMIYNYAKNSVISTGNENLIVELLNKQYRGITVRIEYHTIYEDEDYLEFSF